MPIQFRCGNCKQLLGIARRKAGAVVACPTCGGKTIVPRTPENGSSLEPNEGKKGHAAAPKPGSFSLLERVDVEKLLSNPINQPSAPAGGGKAAIADPLEMKALPAASATVQPNAAKPASIPLIPIDDDDDVPMALSELAQPPTLFRVTPARAIFMLFVFLLSVSGSFLLGMWVGSLK